MKPAIPDETGFTLTSTSFAEGTPIPLQYSCENKTQSRGVSPHLAWSNPPAGTQYFALTVFDPDANDTPHWGVFDIPAATTEFADALRPENSLPSNAWEAIVYTGNAEYAGPCPPPPHDPHTYIFTIHALDEGMPDYLTTPDLGDMDGAIQERILGSATHTGTYDRK